MSSSKDKNSPVSSGVNLPASTEPNVAENFADIDALAEIYMDQFSERMGMDQETFFDVQAGDYDYGNKFLDMLGATNSSNPPYPLGANLSTSSHSLHSYPADQQEPYARKHSRREVRERKVDSSAERTKSSSEDDGDMSDGSVDSYLSYPPTAGSKRRSTKGEGEGLNIRAKNREHAKNTRDRKRKFIEDLKEQLQKVSDEQDRIDRDRKVTLSRLSEQISVRKKILADVLRLRAEACLDTDTWRTMLDENFVCVLPITPYRSFCPDEVIEGQRLFRGIEGMIRDCASLSVMTQSVVSPTSLEPDRKLEWQSTLHNIVLVEDQAMCKYSLTSSSQLPSPSPNPNPSPHLASISQTGMCKAVFSKANKLVYLEEIFDVMSFMQQLRRASNRGDFSVIPNNLSLARDWGGGRGEVRMVVEASEPYRIIAASPTWQTLYQYPPEALLSPPPMSLLHGPLTDPQALSRLSMAMRRGRPHCTVLKTYARGGEGVDIWLRMFPLYSQGQVVQYVGIVERLDRPYPTPPPSMDSISSSSNSVPQASLHPSLTPSLSSSLYLSPPLPPAPSHSVNPFSYSHTHAHSLADSASGTTTVSSGSGTGNMAPNPPSIYNPEKTAGVGTKKKTPPSPHLHKLLTPSSIQSMYVHGNNADGAANNNNNISVYHSMTVDNLSTFNRLYPPKGGGGVGGGMGMAAGVGSGTSTQLSGISQAYRASVLKKQQELQALTQAQAPSQSASTAKALPPPGMVLNADAREKRGAGQGEGILETGASAGTRASHKRSAANIEVASSASSSSSNLDLDMLSGQQLSPLLADSLFGPHTHKYPPPPQQAPSLPSPTHIVPTIPLSTTLDAAGGGRRGAGKGGKPSPRGSGSANAIPAPTSSSDSSFMDVFLEFRNADHAHVQSPEHDSDAAERGRGGGKGAERGSGAGRGRNVGFGGSVGQTGMWSSGGEAGIPNLSSKSDTVSNMSMLSANNSNSSSSNMYPDDYGALASRGRGYVTVPYPLRTAYSSQYAQPGNLQSQTPASQYPFLYTQSPPSQPPTQSQGDQGAISDGKDKEGDEGLMGEDVIMSEDGGDSFDTDMLQFDN